MSFSMLILSQQKSQILLQAILKKGFWFKIEAEANVNPQTYSSISLLRSVPTLLEQVPGFEELTLASNKEFGTKDFFEIACSYIAKIPCYRRKKKILPVSTGGIYTLDSSITYSGDISPHSNIIAIARNPDSLIHQELDIVWPNP
jgi:ribonuclease BN (tRNA processing enzyme)